MRSRSLADIRDTARSFLDDEVGILRRLLCLFLFLFFLVGEFGFVLLILSLFLVFVRHALVAFRVFRLRPRNRMLQAGHLPRYRPTADRTIQRSWPAPGLVDEFPRSPFLKFTHHPVPASLMPLLFFGFQRATLNEQDDADQY